MAIRWPTFLKHLQLNFRVLFRVKGFSFSPPAGTFKVSGSVRFWDLALMTEVVQVWVSGGHLAELPIVSPEHAVGHISSIE